MYSWTDHPLKPGYPNKAVYIQELRGALDGKRKEMGLSPADWSEPIKIGEPKKFSHTQQLMLACDDTAKRYRFNSYQDILKREWTPIQQGGPYKHQIVNDLRQVIDGLVWLGFEERFPGTELDLEKWIVEKKELSWYVDNRFFTCASAGGAAATIIKPRTFKTPKEFEIEFFMSSLTTIHEHGICVGIKGFATNSTPDIFFSFEPGSRLLILWITNYVYQFPRYHYAYATTIGYLDLYNRETGEFIPAIYCMMICRKNFLMFYWKKPEDSSWREFVPRLDIGPLCNYYPIKPADIGVNEFNFGNCIPKFASYKSAFSYKNTRTELDDIIVRKIKE